MHRNSENELMFRIALTLVPGIGPVKSKILLNHCGSAQAIFKEKTNVLRRVRDIGDFTARAISKSDVMRQADDEVEFVLKNEIGTLFYTEENYPERLRSCDDSPILLYTKGEMNLNTQHVISIVGTRQATSYGKQFCEEFIRGIKSHKPVVVSGLAYGIDVCAHRYALKENLPTVACLAHGIDKIYPPLHTTVAREMMGNGGLVTEFLSGTKPDRELFPTRNRIIAGLADCTIVVESDIRGGSVITAEVANGYNRDVFAVPGRYYDRFSSGCNDLIRRNVAAIINSADDLINYMNWDSDSQKKIIQTELFSEFSDDEKDVLKRMKFGEKLSVDLLCEKTGMNSGNMSAILLELEFRGHIKSHPGKLYSSELSKSGL